MPPRMSPGLFRATTKRDVSQLTAWRKNYPFRLVRDHSLTPRPEDVKDVGPFFRNPTRSGDEWGFTTAANRARFIELYGGSILGT